MIAKPLPATSTTATINKEGFSDGAREQVGLESGVVQVVEEQRRTALDQLGGYPLFQFFCRSAGSDGMGFAAERVVRDTATFSEVYAELLQMIAESGVVPAALKKSGILNLQAGDIGDGKG